MFKKGLIFVAFALIFSGEIWAKNDLNLTSVNLGDTENFAADFTYESPREFHNDADEISAQNTTNLSDTEISAQNATNLSDTEILAQNITNLSTQSDAKNDSENAEFDDFEADFEAEFDAFKVNDPLSGYNKFMTSFNVGFYTYFLRPVAKGYDFVMPNFAQTGIKNFFTYISMPIRFISNALQLKFSEAGTELKRFGINTIFGFFGFIDAASKVGVPIYHSDFGLVLAHWGVGGGFHFVLPILGPSNLRDTLSIPVNWYMSPTTYIDTQSHTFISWLSVGLTSFNILNEVSINTPTMDEIYYNTPSLYPFLRDAYEKRRMEQSK